MIPPVTPAVSPAAQPRAGTRRRFDTIALVAALCVLLLHACNYLYFFVDDEGIPFVYAQNLLDGHGLVYNPQDGRVEGYSDFLHIWLGTAILAAARGVRAPRISVFFVGKAISLFFGMAIVWLSKRFFERLNGASPPAVLAGLGFVVLAGPLAVWSASSLETVQFAFVLLALAYGLADEAGDLRSDRLAAAAAAVLVLDRIDGFVYAAILLGTYVLVAAPARRHAFLRRVVAPVAIVTLGYHLWRLAYFHTLLTPPLRTKVLFKLQPHDTLVVRLPGQGYATRFLNLLWWIPAAAIAGALGIAAARRERRLMALALATLLLGIYIGLVGDWMFGFRFFVALVPLLAGLIARDVARLVSWRSAAGWTAALLVVGLTGQSAIAFEHAYEDYQHRPGWLGQPRLGIGAYFPFYGLQDALRARLKPGDTIGTNLGGFVPFMVDAPNVDNLGLVTPLFSELPTTDVIFTEVGRYAPITAKPVLRLADAYLMYRAPTYIAEPRNWLSSANAGVVPPAVFGGRYQLVSCDNTSPDTATDWPWCIYTRAAPLEAFHRCADLYLDNLAHASAVRAVRIDGRPVAPAALQSACPYLAEETGRFSFTQTGSIDLLLARADLPVYELYLQNVTVSAPTELTVTLASHTGTVYRRSFVLTPGQPFELLDRLSSAVEADRAGLLFSSTTRLPVDVSITDVRVQGQSPAVRDFVADRLGLSHVCAGGRPSTKNPS